MSKEKKRKKDSVASLRIDMENLKTAATMVEEGLQSRLADTVRLLHKADDRVKLLERKLRNLNSAFVEQSHVITKLSSELDQYYTNRTVYMAATDGADR